MPLMIDPGSPSGSSTSSKRSAHFIIEPASIEDVRRLVDIEFHAFENERVNHQLSYRDHAKPDHFERSVRMYQEMMEASRHQRRPVKARHLSRSRPDSISAESEVSFLKIVDTESGDIVSFAKMEMKTYSRQELLSPNDVGHETEPVMNRDWFALNERLRREYVGLTKHCYLGMLATQPCYQHHGAGTMLLNEILQEADEAGIIIYLEGTDTARPLYEKHGFEAVNDIFFDPANYDVRDLGVEHQTILVRGALGRNGLRKGVSTWEEAVALSKAELQTAKAK